MFLYWFDNFTLMILALIIGIASILGLVILSILSIIGFKKNKKIKFVLLKFVLSLIFIFGISFSLPFYLVAIAYQQDTNTELEKTLLFAEKVSFIHSLKAAVCYQLSSHYIVNYNGKDAIKFYEKAITLSNKEYKPAKALICFAYFAKPDREKILQTCSDRTIAVDYIRTKEYNKALELINQSIKNSEAENKMNNVCSGYAIRAAIYKQAGDKIAYKKDYDKVISDCSYYKFAKEYAEADNILDVYVKNINKYKF